MARIVLFGATGYTGRLIARDLVRTGAAPLLVGRSADTLTAMVEELNDTAPGGRAASFEVADLDRPGSLRRLLESPDDVVVSAVGPFARLGSVAVEAAIDAGCAYVDCTGEPAFIPTSMSTEAYLCVGQDGNESSFYSCNHGAGKSKNKTDSVVPENKAELDAKLKTKGVTLYNGRSSKVIEQDSSHYKQASDVIASVQENGIVKPVAKMQPVSVIMY